MYAKNNIQIIENRFYALNVQNNSPIGFYILNKFTKN